MPEGELVNGAPEDEDVLDEDAEGGEELDDGRLDDEADALLKELQDSQLEVQRMIDAQRLQASELGDMKESLVTELQQLQDESWKLQVFAELEMLKRQLAAINSLDADLDAMEARLEGGGEAAVDEDFEKELAAARAETRTLLAKMGLQASGSDAGGSSSSARAGPKADEPTGAALDAGASGSEATHSSVGVGASRDEGKEEVDAQSDGDGGDVEALQDELDAELAAMYKQLQDIKAESAQVAARKAQLELELMQLLREGADELTSQLQDLAEGEAAAAEGEGDGDGGGGGEALAAAAADTGDAGLAAETDAALAGSAASTAVAEGSTVNAEPAASEVVT